MNKNVKLCCDNNKQQDHTQDNETKTEPCMMIGSTSNSNDVESICTKLGRHKIC